MKSLFFFCLLSLALMNAPRAQNYFTKNGKLSFFSKTSMENIDAVNNQAISVLNIKTCDIGFSVLIKGFLFKKALMQEHFNEDYMESDKYPKAIFKGVISDIKMVNFMKDGSYTVTVTGDLNMHGVSNKVKLPGTVSIKGGKISAAAVFSVAVADYKISIPKLVENNISKTIEVKVDCNYEPK